MSHVELNNSNFKDAVKEGVTLVDFWAPWCGPCRVVGPIVEELAGEFEGKAKIAKVNTDEEQDLAVEFGIRSIPTLMIFKDGELVDTMIGVVAKEDLEEKLNTAIA